jgi:hypothetical protein
MIVFPTTEGPGVLKDGRGNGSYDFVPAFYTNLQGLGSPRYREFLTLISPKWRAIWTFPSFLR